MTRRRSVLASPICAPKGPPPRADEERRAPFVVREVREDDAEPEGGARDEGALDLSDEAEPHRFPQNTRRYALIERDFRVARIGKEAQSFERVHQLAVHGGERVAP